MFAIGFHESEYVFYEGQIGYGRAIWPAAPVLSVATLIREPRDTRNIPPTHTLVTQLVFREDSFDAQTRIRRGRLYKWADGYSQPHRWNVQPHPAYTDELNPRVRPLTKDLYTWAAWPAFQHLGRRSGGPLLALGAADVYTLWRVLDIERIVTGEDLITLRLRGSLGVLPEVDPNAIPLDGREKALQTIEALANAAYRSEPESIIDLARAAAQWCLGTWLADKRQDPEIRKKDLGHLVKLLEDGREKDIAGLVARFHSRAKPNEQANYRTRDVSEEDAEFCLASIALLLRELNWVKW